MAQLITDSHSHYGRDGDWLPTGISATSSASQKKMLAEPNKKICTTMQELGASREKMLYDRVTRSLPARYGYILRISALLISATTYGIR